MTLDKWVHYKAPTPRPATLEDVEPLYNTFQRVRKLKALMWKFTNVEVKFEAPYTDNPDEWALVVEVRKSGKWFHVTAVPLRTTDKATATRRAWGWGLKDEDGNVNWPPEPDGPVPDEPHVPDVDEAAYFHYWRF